MKRSIRILPSSSQVRSKFGSLFELGERVAKGKLANQQPVKMASINSLEHFTIQYLFFPRIYGNIFPSRQQHSIISEFPTACFFKFLQQICYLKFFLFFAFDVIDDLSIVHHDQAVSDIDGIFHVVGYHHGC